MTRIYESPGNRLRMRISVIALVGLILLGIWYLAFQALAAPAGVAGFGPWILSIAFIVAGGGGLLRVFKGGGDRVIALDMDEETGKAVLWLWSPLGARRIRTEIGKLTGWRYRVSGGRSRRTRYRCILADLEGRARPVIFDLRHDYPVPNGLRRIAPEAINEFEREAGIG